LVKTVMVKAATAAPGSHGSSNRFMYESMGPLHGTFQSIAVCEAGGDGGGQRTTRTVRSIGQARRLETALQSVGGAQEVDDAIP
jgi:hypothetical protein